MRWEFQLISRSDEYKIASQFHSRLLFCFVSHLQRSISIRVHMSIAPSSTNDELKAQALSQSPPTAAAADIYLSAAASLAAAGAATLQANVHRLELCAPIFTACVDLAHSLLVARSSAGARVSASAPEPERASGPGPAGDQSARTEPVAKVDENENSRVEVPVF